MTNKQEQGRSMVEMLGVLAVVGVLSAGGIAGYTYAMDRHRTNELLNEASKRAVVVASQIASGRTPSLAEFGTGETAGGTFSTDAVTDIDDAVGIKVTGVKDSVCENLVKLENDRVYMAKDDDSLTALTEADCTGDNAEFLIVFEGMGGGTDGGTTITCDESEKKWITYYTGECCEVYHREKFCPGDEPTTCVKASSACDCEDESCCSELGGSWATDDWGDYYICCAEGTALCSANKECICVPSGYSSDCNGWYCISCSPSEGRALCPYDGKDKQTCICVSEGYSSACGWDVCKACSPSEGRALCPDYGDCICVSEGYSSACNEYYCKACSPTEGVAVCRESEECQCISSAENCLNEECCSFFSANWSTNSYGGICCSDGIAVCPNEGKCICVSEGYSSACNEYYCKACSPEDGTAICSEKGDCYCIPEGYSSACNEYYCKACSSEDGTATCFENGSCTCVPSGYSSACNDFECKHCSLEDGTALCPIAYGSCICAPSGYGSMCNYASCVGCPSGQTPSCDGEWGECTCS